MEIIAAILLAAYALSVRAIVSNWIEDKQIHAGDVIILAYITVIALLPAAFLIKKLL